MPKLVQHRRREPEAKPPGGLDVHAVLAASTDPIVLVDATGRVAAFNEAACALVAEIGDGPLVECEPFTAFAKLGLEPGLRAQCLTRALGGEAIEIAGVLPGGGNTGQRVSVRFAPLRGRDAEVSGAMITVRRSEAVRDDAAQAQLAARVRAMREHSSDVISILDADGTVRDNSPAIERVLGYQPEELVGRNALDLVHPDDRRHVAERLAATIVNPNSFVAVEFRCRHKDGRWIDLEAIGSSHLEDPSVGGVIVNSRDVSARRRVEETNRALVEHSLQGLMIVSGTHVLFANERAAEILETTREALTGAPTAPLRQRLHPDDLERATSQIRALQAGVVGGRSEFRIVRPDGGIRWLEAHGSSIAYQGRRALHVALLDVTERKKAEAELLETSRRMKLLLDHLPAVVWTVDRNLDALTIAGAALPPEALPGGRPPNAPGGPGGSDPVPAIVAAHRRALAGEHVDFRTSWVGRSYDCHVEPLRNDENEIVAAIGIAQDVTDRAAAQQERRRSEELYHLLVDQAPIGIVLTDRSGQITAANPAALSIVGSPSAEATKSFNVFTLEPLQRAGVSEYFATAFRDKRVVREEAHYRSLWGREADVSITVAPLLDEDREVLGLLAMIEDVTRPRRAEQEAAAISKALAQVGRELISSLNSEELLSRLCRVTADVLGCDRSRMVLLDQDGPAWVPVATHGDDPAAWEVIRQQRWPAGTNDRWQEQLRGEHVVHLEAATDSIASALQRQEGVTSGLYLALNRGDDLIAVLSAERFAPGNPFLPMHERIARGIAQLASLALEDARLLAELERASRLKSEFVATMSHELRTPLNIILGYHELLLDDTFGALNPEQRDSLTRADRNARTLLDLINATLDMSRLEAGEAPTDVREVDVASLLRELETDLRDLRERSALELRWITAPGLPLLRTDPSRLATILRNLVGNAVKFTERGHVEVNAQPRGGGVEIAVSDTGVGISDEALPIIFEAFRQAEPMLRRNQGGVGLGLYIVRRLIDELGGSIEVDSALGRGTTFRVWLPSGGSPARSAGEGFGGVSTPRS